jgi:hypothetical protein
MVACSGAPGEELGRVEEALSTGVVISQVYGAGGNSGALYTNDFVELFNRGATTVSLSGWSVQYAAAGGTSWTAVSLGAKSIPPGGHFLVQLGPMSTTGAALPTPDATGSINMAAASGRVALANVTTSLSCLLSCAGNAKVVDYVGYGLALDYEGSGPAPLGTTLTSVVRSGNGCTETDDNSADFGTSVPSPHNSTNAPAICPGVDAGPDTGEPDTGAIDTGTLDTGTIDTGSDLDTGTIDTGSDLDSGTIDTGSVEPDASVTDSGAPSDASGADAEVEDSSGGSDARVDTGTSKRGSVDDLPTASPCGCRTPGAPVPFGLAPVFLAFAIALGRRRR